MSNHDDVFLQYVKDLENEKKQKDARTSTFTSEFDNVKWVGLEHDKMKIVRLIGNTLAPDFVGTEPEIGDAIEFIFAEVKDDNGKKMQLKLPIDDPSSNNRHIMHRIISEVMKVQWVNKEKVFPVKLKHPDIFNIIEKGNFVETDSNYKFARGWKGQRVAVFNCIDRSDMEWHRTNKKTKLLSKQVGVSVGENGDTIEWPFYGVPSYGFITELFSLVKIGGSWENYDIGIEKTGKMNKPYNIVNLTRFKQKDFLDDFMDKSDDANLISVEGDLTSEEKSWERVNIQKMFKVTPYTKIFKRLGNQIKKIDAALNTHFYDELDKLAREEEAERAEARKTEAENTVVENEVYIESSVLTEDIYPDAPRPEPISRTVNSNNEPSWAKYLKGWDKLSEVHRNMITDVIVVDGEIKSISYSEAAGKTGECPVSDGGCGFESPMTFPYCPVCGAKYS